jgi:hypothetical protein
MSDQPERIEGGSWAVQGCLIGAVALFAILLLVMIVLAYNRFREETGGGGPPATTSMVMPAPEPMAPDGDPRDPGTPRAVAPFGLGAAHG